MMINKKVLQSSIITDRRTASQDNKIIPNLNYFTMDLIKNALGLFNLLYLLQYNCSTLAIFKLKFGSISMF